MQSAAKKSAVIAVLLFLLGAIIVFDMSRVELERGSKVPPLPEPVTNNAVVSVAADGKEFLISFAGLGPGKSHADAHAKTYIYESGAGQWREGSTIPGVHGRLAATAVAVDELAYVFGGYTVTADGDEKTMRWVHAYDPVADEFTELQPMPVPVDDAVAVVFESRYVYLVSGWHDFGNVNLVQRYDTEFDTWSQATPTPGRPVFGHAGGIVDNIIVYCDGVAIEAYADERREFVANPECFAGTIDTAEGRRIDWRRLEPHPGAPRYRMAAAGMTDEDGVIFIGGSENPYNYDGVGYDGAAAEPAQDAWLYRLDYQGWQEVDIDGAGTMDHRGLVSFGDTWVTVGGMTDDQEVTDSVYTYAFD
jgi:hypothetical protein